RPPIGRDAAQILPVEQDAALARLLEAGEHAQERGLAAARRAEQREELALVDRQRQIVDGGEVAEPLGDVLEGDIGACRRIVPRREASADAAERFHAGSPGFRYPGRWAPAAFA